MTSAPTTQSDKAARGTKRVCQACEVRFYDLRRDPIVCPSCGAHYTPAAQPLAEAGRRAAPVGGKTGWRQSVKRPSPVLPEPNPEDAIRPEVAAEAEDPDGRRRRSQAPPRMTISSSTRSPRMRMSPA
jgi:uncharacterized protein (TIGR02300 family)